MRSGVYKIVMGDLILNLEKKTYLPISEIAKTLGINRGIVF